MVTVTNAPIGSSRFTGVVRAGDPTPYAADPRLVTLLYPYPQSGAPTYLSCNTSGLLTAVAGIGPNELFQESNHGATAGVGMLECERSGPFQFGITYGLF